MIIKEGRRKINTRKTRRRRRKREEEEGEEEEMEKKQGGRRKRKNRKQNKFKEYREVGMTLGRVYLGGRTENEYDMYIYEITKAKEAEPQLGYVLLRLLAKGASQESPNNPVCLTRL